MPHNYSRSIKLATLALFAAASVAFAFGATLRTDASIEPAASLNSSQASLYRANCARCHGNDGHADTPKGRETDADDLTTAKVKAMSAAKMARIIKNGKGDMPSFKKLSAAQITALIGYVKSL